MTARLGASGDRLSEDARALIDMLTTAGSSPDLQTLLARLTRSGCELTGAAYAVMAVYDRDGRLKELATHGVEAEVIEGSQALQTRAGVLGRVLCEGRTVRATAAETAMGLPASHPVVATFLGAPILVGAKAQGVYYLANRSGGPFTAAEAELVGGVGKSLAVVIAHARAQEESERRRAWLEASVRVYGEMTPAMRREDTLTRLVTSVREVTGASLVALLDGADPLEIAAMSGDAALVAQIVEELHDMIVDASRTNRVTTIQRDRGASLLIPLRTEIAPPGVLLAEHPSGWTGLRALEQDLMAGFSEQAGLAIDRAYAISERHQSLLTADRDRIARDLHDLVIQRLFATGLHLQGARALATDRVRDRIDKTITDLDSSIRDIRSIIFELHHGAKVPLREAVREVIAEYAPILGFTPVLRFAGPIELSVDSAGAEHAVATLREALSNVARHAQARSVYVEVEVSADFLTMRVSDDGVGLSPDHDQTRTGGLVNARQRAESMGGGLEVVRRTPRGTTFKWWIPVSA